MLSFFKSYQLRGQRNTCSQNGFTLIELMITVVIIGILTALGLPNYQIWIENTRIRNAADSIQAGLQTARVEAIRRNSDVRFVLGVNSAWTIGCINVTAACPDPIETRAANDGSSVNITVIATPAGATTVVFTNLGQVRQLVDNPPAATAPFTQLAIDSSKLAASDSRDLQIRLSGGAVRMCDPYSGLSASDPRKC